MQERMEIVKILEKVLLDRNLLEKLSSRYSAIEKQQIIYLIICHALDLPKTPNYTIDKIIDESIQFYSNYENNDKVYIPENF